MGNRAAKRHRQDDPEGVPGARAVQACVQGGAVGSLAGREHLADAAFQSPAASGAEEDFCSFGGSSSCSSNNGTDYEEKPKIHLVKVVYKDTEDTEPLYSKLQDVMEDLGLDPDAWRPAGPPKATDGQNLVIEGRPDRETIEFPLTLEIPMVYVSKSPNRGSESPSTNPFDTGVYSAPTMTEEEAAKLTVPFSKVSEQLRPVLEEHGAAIVTDVIPEDELVPMEADFAQDLMDLIDEGALEEAGPEANEVQEAYARFKAEGPKAFPIKEISRLTAAAGFSVKSCLSQGRFAWRARRHPKVQAVYKAIYPEAGDLVSSMDVTFFTPEGQPCQEENGFSAHVDQNSNDVRPGLDSWESYQGVLYVWPSTADGKSSTTVVWPGSHRGVWEEMMKDECFVATGQGGFHYSEIKEMWNEDAARELAEGWAKNARRMVVPRGSLVLWNSRTVHTGWRGGPRLAQTVCFEPAERRPEAERLGKLRLAALGLPSTHWASAAMQHDIVLGDAGYLAMLTEGGQQWQPTAGLPLRSAIRPASLAEDADLEALAALVGIKYKLTGMWDPPEGISDLLEASVKGDFKLFL